MEPIETRKPDLTVSQAARLAGVSVDTIRRYCNDNTLRSYRTPKNARRIIVADLVEVFPRIATPTAPAADLSPRTLAVGASSVSGDAA